MEPPTILPPRLVKKPNQKARAEERLGVYEKFRDRLEWEGRLPEFEKAANESAAQLTAKYRAQGKKVPIAERSRAFHKLVRDHGYESAAEEKQLYLQREEERKQGAKSHGELKEIESQEAAWEEALRALPTDVAGKLPPDLLWVYTHPAMSRKARDPKGEFVVLTAEDIKDAPSVGAASSLAFWVNEPLKLFQSILERMKKEEIEREADDEGTILDMGRSEVLSLLNGLE